MCTFCKAEKETVVHILWQCNIVKLLWFRIIKWIHEKSNIIINVSMKDVLIGIQSTDAFLNMLNAIFVIVKQYIYACKCLQNNPCITQCKSAILRIIETEKYIATKNDKLMVHNKKWQFISVNY